MNKICSINCLCVVAAGKVATQFVYAEEYFYKITSSHSQDVICIFFFSRIGQNVHCSRNFIKSISAKLSSEPALLLLYERYPRISFHYCIPNISNAERQIHLRHHQHRRGAKSSRKRTKNSERRWQTCQIQLDLDSDGSGK